MDSLKKFSFFELSKEEMIKTNGGDWIVYSGNDVYTYRTFAYASMHAEFFGGTLMELGEDNMQRI